MARAKLTPLMQQYFDIKQQHSDTLLFFQVGDFYELFFDDAVTAAAYLAITLTKRGKKNGQDIPLCGVPLHALNHYLVKLIKGGYKVAICDQITEPKPGTVVERAVTRVLTPGTLTDANMLDAQSASYLMTLYPGKDEWGILFAELLTAQLFATTIPAGQIRMLEAEMIRFLPDEIIIPEGKKITDIQQYLKTQGYVTSTTDDAIGSPVSTAWIESQFAHAKKQLEGKQAITNSLSLFHSYVAKNQAESLEQFKQIQMYDPQDYVVLDSATQRNLDLIKNSRDNTKAHTLLSVLDGAQTAMGSRTIKKWLLRPLVHQGAIEQRHEAVELVAKNVGLLGRLEDQLKQVADLERIVGRIGLDRASVHDYTALQKTLKLLPHITSLLQPHTHVGLINIILGKCSDFSPLTQLLDASIADEPTPDNLIKKGFDKKLDELRELTHNGKAALYAFEQQEVKSTGISSLKVGYNQVAGYYIEVTNPNISKVPEHYKQYQKLANRQRYVTDELKEFERKITQAKTQTSAVEKDVYQRVKQEVKSYLSQLRHVAQALSYLDGLYGFARVAYNNEYVRPTFGGEVIDITHGRHPVVERSHGAQFVANDTKLGGDSLMWIVTGPNMGGKSTYLRQVALITIMAQAGSFVPAQSATLPLVDRVFTRIGAGDDVAQGKSTFLVEMEETAVICTQATTNSLVILDEVGRGTSTYDGMALAQAIVEYLHQKVKTRALFATHYHELTELAATHDGIDNYYMKSEKTKDGLLFLHELAPGVAQASFGLEVAKLAQLPEAVVKRAEQILQHLHAEASPTFIPAQSAGNLDVTALENKIQFLQERLTKKEQQLAALDQVNLDDLSPRKAFDVVWELKVK